MAGLQAHLRTKLLAGALAAGPVLAVAWAAVWVEQQTRPLAQAVGWDVPGLGVVIALAGVYVLGLLVTSLFGRLFLRLLDWALDRLPGLRLLYRTWKDVTAPGREGVMGRVVLVLHPGGRSGEIGFSGAAPVPGRPRTFCVFVPGAPNPLAGRVLLVDQDACVPLGLSLEEAFKLLVSTGNYLPPGLPGLTPAAPGETAEAVKP
jgi:uncharacterized membrane protein